MRVSKTASLGLVLGAALIGSDTGVARIDCSLVHTGQVPLSDLYGSYRGYEGGLYPNGMTARPPGHESVGVDLARQHVRPLNAQGQPDDASGRIVLLSIGMSNTSTEFGRFLELVRDDEAVNPRLVVVNGAVSGQTADRYRDPNSQAWQWTFDQLARSNVSRQQVQVAWVKVVLAGFGSNTSDPLANFPVFPQQLQADLQTISRNLRINFPNIRLAFFSSRIRAYVTPRGLSPEPTAYETGFAVRWAIANQINGAPDLGLDVAPWMSWGPYLWADGLTPRSDGLTYACSDLDPDFVHPGPGASEKVARQLRAFFMTDPAATPWYLKPASGAPTLTSATATPPGGERGVQVQFAASAFDPDGIAEFVWTFGDGTFAYGATPRKTFIVPGNYTARVTVVDRLGNAVQAAVPVSVGGGSDGLPSAPRNLTIRRPPGAR